MTDVKEKVFKLPCWRIDEIICAKYGDGLYYYELKQIANTSVLEDARMETYSDLLWRTQPIPYSMKRFWT